MKRLVFFGAGNISQAIIDGLIDGGYGKENISYGLLTFLVGDFLPRKRVFINFSRPGPAL